MAKAKAVCVTGASGFIGSWLVKFLLQRGYVVNATVRNINDSTKFDHLKALEGAKERLFLFQANLLEHGSFDDAVNGCHAVFHSASPVIFENITDPQKELIEPAVGGTLNVLQSCAKLSSIKRVVFTSSMCSVLLTKSINSKGVLADESWFSDPELCRATEEWYIMSKILAEEAAMKFVQENVVDLVIINPGLTIGPIIQPTINWSSEIFLSLTTEGKGSTTAMPRGNFVFVDVRDVANAHILAMEKPCAEGRYCLVQKVVSVYETLMVIKQHYPTLLRHQPSLVLDQVDAPTFQVSNEKAKSLGVEFIGLEQSVKDTIESLLERNLINLERKD